MAVKLAVLLTAIGLISLLVMHGLGRDTHDSLYPNPGVAHWHFGLWELLNDVTGTVIVMAGTLVPIYFYRTCRRSENRATAKSRTRDLTILMTVLLLARMLGNVY